MPRRPPLLLAHHAATRLREGADDEHKKAWGQYFTPEPLARFAAGLVETDPSPRGGCVRILDPGAGTGILGLSLAERLLREHATLTVHLTAVEHEPSAAERLAVILEHARAAHGRRLSVELIVADFLTLAEVTLGGSPLQPFDLAIANPPYFKLSPADPRGGDAPNIYARFMDVTATLLRPAGKLCFIIPRSFTSGYYFRRFRRRFHHGMELQRVHVFESRRDAFRVDKVLQETIIVVYAKQSPRREVPVRISASSGTDDMAGAVPLEVSRSEVVDLDGDAVVNLPTSQDSVELAEKFRRWGCTLESLGLQVSTGPVVPFRAVEQLEREASEATVPMLWLQHVRANAVDWPLGDAFRKREHIRRDAGPKLLVENRNYVLLRRFSAKEEQRRLTAAPLLSKRFAAPLLGLENHLNYIHAIDGELSPAQARGLAAFLNSAVVDAYFRSFSGNTQVSATELRSLPMPPMRALERLGRMVSKRAALHAIEDAIGEQLVGHP